MQDRERDYQKSWRPLQIPSFHAQCKSSALSTKALLTLDIRTIDLPLPTARLATIAQRTLQVDKELSPLVRRSFSTVSPASIQRSGSHSSETSILRTEYKATTNRMLRVAVNGFMESLGVVLGVMEELDIDMLGVDPGKD